MPPDALARAIEAATHSDVAGSYLCAHTHPNPDLICPFRAHNETSLRAAFVSVLQLAQALRLTKVGTVSVDGIIKEVMGFRRFLLRGRAKVNLEWSLVCVSYNLKRIFALKNWPARDNQEPRWLFRPKIALNDVPKGHPRSVANK